MSDLLDQKIRSAVVELMESSPPPHPAHQAMEQRSRRLSSPSLTAGVVRMASVAAVVLLVGLAGAWLVRNLAPPEAADVSVVDGVLAPEPGFDPAQFGDETPLLPSTGDLVPDVPEDTLEGDVVAVGQIDGTELEVFIWNTIDGETCVQIVGPQLRESSCSDTPAGGFDPSDPLDGPDPFVTTFFDADSGETDVVAVWRVPDDTAVVGLAANRSGMWQRPVSGIVAFAFGGDISRVVFDAVDTERLTLAVAFFSPRQIVDPVQAGELEVEGSAEDIVELEGSHPVNEIISEGATDVESFAEAASGRDLRFNCGAGEGGSPSWGYCLVGLDGVLVVVPFGDEPGLTVRISDPGLVEDVVIPLDRTEPVGVANLTVGPPARVEYFGIEIGALSAPGILDGGV